MKASESPSSPPRPVRAREPVLVALLALALYVPFLGTYNMWDPWETHYGEVARRMLEEHDWVKLRWQNESFRSKPVLTFWLMGAGMKVFGVGEDGGFSGEFVSSPKVEWAIRLPFALFGAAGVVFLWLLLARLYSRRAAWLGATVLATCPYYFFISRQGITDMPMCALLIGSMALFVLAIWDERPLRRWRFGLNANHIFLLAFTIVVVPQLVYMIPNVAGTRLYLSRSAFLPGPWIIAAFIPFFVAAFAWTLFRGRTTTQVSFSWFYLLSGIAVLAKPPAPAVAGLIILGFLALTGEWKLLRKCEIPRGVLIGGVVSLPWHFAMYLRDGNGWLNEYLSQHLLGRTFIGVFGDRGTFDYYFGQLGVGMWPWVCLVPGALIALALAGRPRTREEKIRLLFGIWGVAGFAFIAFVRTKFHHYILPAVPGLAVVAALWLDDAWEGRAKRVGLALAVAIGLFLVTSIDLVAKQERLVHLFCFRYDRPWPYDKPWDIDFSGWILALAIAFGACLLAFGWARFRRIAIVGMCAVGVLFAVLCVDFLLPAASPHWGQRMQHRVYYENRRIHGADVFYYGLEHLVADWDGKNEFEVRSFIPYTLHEGDPMRIAWQLRGPGETVQEQGEVRGVVSQVSPDEHRFVIKVTDVDPKLQALVDKGRGARDGKRRFLTVNADRMISWGLLWRGENFYSGGEIWNPRIPDMQVAFNDGAGDANLQKYLKERLGQGRTFWVVSEKNSLNRLPGLLPTDKAKQTFRKMENFSNKFGVSTFTLD